MTRTHTPSPETREALQAINAHLPDGELRLEGTPVALPAPVAALLRDMLASLAAGEPVAVITQDSEISPNEAAQMLNVSRGTITNLMEDGTLPYRMVGTHRRLPAAAVAAYKARLQKQARSAMDELVRLSQEAGDYDTDDRNR